MKKNRSRLGHFQCQGDLFLVQIDDPWEAEEFCSLSNNFFMTEFWKIWTYWLGFLFAKMSQDDIVHL